MLAKFFTKSDREVNEGPAPFLHGYPDNDFPKLSPYYWWFQYLKRHEGYIRCCDDGGAGEYATLYSDWGDVRTDDFDEWFFENGQLFREPDVPDYLAEVAQISDLKDLDWSAVMVVVCPIRNGSKILSKRDIKAQFSEMVDARFPNRIRGRPEFKTSAKYRVLGYPNLKKLEEFLAVYDLRKAEPDLYLWQIGERLHYEKKINSGRHHVTTKTDTKDEVKDKRKIMTILVKRHLTTAEKYINSAIGSEFPIRSKSALNT
jgi:hypothetical protein